MLYIERRSTSRRLQDPLSMSGFDLNTSLGHGIFPQGIFMWSPVSVNPAVNLVHVSQREVNQRLD